MIFDWIAQNIFTISLIVFFILVALFIGICLEMFWLLRKEKKEKKEEIFPPKDLAKNELFLRISEDFKEKLGELLEKEIQKNIGEFKNAFQKTSEEIIRSYQNQFASGGQETREFFTKIAEQISGEISNFSKVSLEMQNKILEEGKKVISELNELTEKEFLKIQEANLEASSRTYLSIKETLSQKLQETEKEIENYKKEKFKEIDQKIYQMLGEVAKKTLGKAIDLSTHERLVMEALEKAKREIF